MSFQNCVPLVRLELVSNETERIHRSAFVRLSSLNICGLSHDRLWGDDAARHTLMSISRKTWLLNNDRISQPLSLMFQEISRASTAEWNSIDEYATGIFRRGIFQLPRQIISNTLYTSTRFFVIMSNQQLNHIDDFWKCSSISIFPTIKCPLYSINLLQFEWFSDVKDGSDMLSFLPRNIFARNTVLQELYSQQPSKFTSNTPSPSDEYSKAVSWQQSRRKFQYFDGSLTS